MERISSLFLQENCLSGEEIIVSSNKRKLTSLKQEVEEIILKERQFSRV